MRRKLTLRKMLLTAAPLLLAALPVVAEEAPAAAGSAEPIISIVSGLAPDDLLNIRATASALGKTEARLPSGTSVKNYGCNNFNGYPWCKVEDLKNPNLVGWAPARYLTPNNPATVPEDQIAAAAPQPGAAQALANPPASNNPPVEQAMIASVAATEPGTTSRVTAPASPAPQASVSPPPDLAARLGGADHGKPVSAADIGKTAMQDAVGLAYAANDNPATGEIAATVTPQAPAEQAADSKQPAEPAAALEPPTEPATAKDATDQASQASTPATDDDPPTTGAAVPVPTPRPDSEAKAPAAKAETVARLEPAQKQVAGAGPDATGEIPCARYVGQPMTRCAVAIVRGDNGKADVTVSWPDGGTRVISFHGGQPTGADSRGEFRFTREGSLSMIRVGVSERFEITDTLALGD